MRVNGRVAAASLVAGIIVVACSAPGPTNAVAYEQFRFTCCVSSDVLQAWHAGEAFTLEWIVENAGMTSDPAQHPVTLTALLTGPYASVAALKTGGAHLETLAATPVHVTDRAPGNPVSSISLPLGFPAGWYNLAFSIASEGGNRVGGSSVIQVTRAGP